MHHFRKTVRGLGSALGVFVVSSAFVLTAPVAPAEAGTVGSGPISTSGLCLTTAGGSAANGAGVQLAGCTSTSAQSWSLASDGTIRLSDKCLDVANGAVATGSAIDLYDCNGTAA